MATRHAACVGVLKGGQSADVLQARDTPARTNACLACVWHALQVICRVYGMCTRTTHYCN